MHKGVGGGKVLHAQHRSAGVDQNDGKRTAAGRAGGCIEEDGGTVAKHVLVHESSGGGGRPTAQRQDADSDRSSFDR